MNPCQVRQHTDLRIARGGERGKAEIASPHARIAPFAFAGLSRGPPGSSAQVSPSDPLRRRRGARGRTEREVLPGWMEGRSGAVVVLATGIDPSPLVLPRRAALPFSPVRYCCASVLLDPSYPLAHAASPPSPSSTLSSLSFSNALGDAHTDWRAAGYARTRYIRANADHSSHSSTRLLNSLTLLSLSLPPVSIPGSFLLIFELSELEYLFGVH